MYLPIVDECNKRVWHPERAFMFFMPFFWKHLGNVHRLNTYVSGLIWKRWAERKTGEKTGDMLDRVLDTYEKENPGQDLTTAAAIQFRDEMKTFMLAGHETSAAMMTWALYELMGDETLMKQVSTEGECVFGKATDKDWALLQPSSLPSREELANLTIAEGCLKVRMKVSNTRKRFSVRRHFTFFLSILIGGFEKILRRAHGDTSSSDSCRLWSASGARRRHTPDRNPGCSSRSQLLARSHEV
jgi:hypothetical protein